MPYINITTRIEGRKDEDLFQKKGGRGFPYIVFLDQGGDLIAKQPGNARTVEGFQKTLDGDVKHFADLQAKAKAGDPAAQVDLALLEGDLGRIPFEEIEQRIAGKELSEAQSAMLVDVELGLLMAELDKAKSEDEANASAKKVADSFGAGRIPNDAEKKQRFIQISLSYAVREENPDLAQKAFDALRPLYEAQHGKDNPQLQRWIQQVSDKIAEMRAATEGCGDDEGMEEGCGEESEGDK